MKHILLLTLLVFSLLSSIAPAQQAPAHPDAKNAPQVQLTGTLARSIAIGGETTGWVLRHGDKQRVKLLLPVEAFAWIKDGLVVSVTGAHSTKEYPERGKVAVFIVKQISQVVN